jgi:dextranase
MSATENGGNCDRQCSVDLKRRLALQSLTNLASSALLLSGCAGGASVKENINPPLKTAPTLGHVSPIISGIASNRTAHLPGSSVTIVVTLSSATGFIASGSIEVAIFHLGVLQPGTVRATFPDTASSRTGVRLNWQAPDLDYRGYLLEVKLKDSDGAMIDSKTGAIDVSSDWRKFPRYGFLTDYSGKYDAALYVEQLNALHINALQFYDWQWKHHRPVKGPISNPDPAWQELSGKTVQKAVVNSLIAAAHDRGMVALQYNLIYGAASDFASDGVDAAWGLYDKPNGSQWRFGPFPSSWTTPYLYLFNPANSNWQKYILDREMEVLEAFKFDGWHADTVGDWGVKYGADGSVVDIKSTFRPFLRAARERLGNYQLVMNVVGAKGHTEVNTSPIDVAYMEIWPWDGIPDYKSLKDIIDTTRAESGGKSLVVPAYMNYDYAKTKSDQSPGLFNDPGVLLTEATVMAAGGVRFELGDGGYMLCNEYFPNRSLVMSSTLKVAIQHYWDFLVGYQNLLRDGQNDVRRLISIDSVAVSDSGARNTVWAFAKKGNGHEVLHFINLLGVVHTSWRDTNADQSVPAARKDLWVNVYTTARASQAYFASPDHEGGRALPIAVTQGNDVNGPFVRFQLPALAYWSMVWLTEN